jgi:hypothetical protein
MSAGGSIGMVLDRALNVDLLDVALRVETEHGGASDARRLLTVALRDHVSAQEAEGKTKKCLSRIMGLATGASAGDDPLGDR